MSLPGVEIIVVNGGLGRSVQTQDGLSGLVVTNTATPEGSDVEAVVAYTPFLVTSRRTLKEMYDNGQLDLFAYTEIDDFFKEAGDGSQLYVMTVGDAETLEDICDHTQGNSIAKLLDFAAGAIRLVGISLKPGSAPSIQYGIAQGTFAAGALLEAARLAYTANIQPFRALLPAMYFNGTATDLRNRTAEAIPGAGFVIGGKDNTKIPAVGLALGRMAAIPVQRNMGRVKDGPITLENAYVGATKIEDRTDLDVINDRGYIFPRAFQGRAGYYWNDDPAFCTPASDFANLGNGRVIDKALTIVYDTYIDEVNDEVQVDSEGRLPVSVVKYLEGKVENRVNDAMAKEISAFRCTIDPNQNIISNGKLTIKCSITPVGYFKDIEVELGFENPFSNS